MASNTPFSSSTAAGAGEKSYFEQQRELLLTQIAATMEQVLTNMNTLNRNLESAIDVGKEFESVEELWSRFEGVMGRDQGLAQGGEGEEGEGEGR
ncbi:hypothetical protein EX30DRAFT_337557 [Ascodesmis nigricans]|uniref:DASH complex subunit DAD1 n=1 Tax=Ascodesmis nigricans TaxID=341454 RepID=A0A4S2N738_9PEZI|nr:hypothetical protein EX30DRAFT_337557 [Ascodesmis nigricans]